MTRSGPLRPATGTEAAGAPLATRVPLGDLGTEVAGLTSRGARFAGLFAIPDPSGTRLVAVSALPGSLVVMESHVPAGQDSFPALTPMVPAAAWYEREIHDLFGLHPSGHPRLDPLILPLAEQSSRPDPMEAAGPHAGPGERPGEGPYRSNRPAELDSTPLPAHLKGEGVFTIPYGPVRSGVFESIEYLLETAGEVVPHLRSRIHHKHRGIERSFEGMTTADAVLLAERMEGVASVAHAIAFCEAVERISGATIPRNAELLRVVHAELERIANHLDSMIRHTEAAGQAVAFARLSLHKERILRLVARLCGHRFGRGVVQPGGVLGPPRAGSSEVLTALERIEASLRADADLLMRTPSFLDRLRGTGVLPRDLVAAHGALGPVAKGSGQLDDARLDRPYAAYARLGWEPFRPRDGGDALARQWVRLDEIWGSFHLARQALDEMVEPAPWHVPLPDADGEAIGWAEAPQGEVLYLVKVEQGRVTRVKPRSASFHNLAIFPAAFPKDIFTDFAFIEASFGFSVAGAAG